MTTKTKLQGNIQEAREYLDKIVGTDYSFWTDGPVPDGAPAWARNGKPPAPAAVKGTSCFCAGVPNLARRAVGLEIPTLGSSDYDGGIVAYFGSTDPAPADWPRQGYFAKNGRQRRFDLKEARQRPWTLIGRKFRQGGKNGDQGHVAIVLPNGKVLQSDPDRGVNTQDTLEETHAWKGGNYYEVMVFAEDWLLPFGHKEKEPRDDREEPRPERPDEDEAPLLTVKQLAAISQNPDPVASDLAGDIEALVPEMRKAGITTRLRMAAFLGNVCQETDRLNTLREYDNASGTYLRSKPYYPYYGRGYLQNTWKDAYVDLSRVLGADLVRNPDLLARNKNYAARAAVWFWKQHNLNAYADRGEFKKVCAIINTGSPGGEPNHLAERIQFYDRAKRVLVKAPKVARDKPDRDRPDRDKPDRDQPDRDQRDEQRRNGFNRDGLPYINLAAVGQADETIAFVLAAEIRKAGIGVTVANGEDAVHDLAKQIRKETKGSRQLWILGGPALEACDEYGDLANWPPSPKTEYYDLAGKTFTGTCQRAAELADEQARQGVGQNFLEAMGLEEPGPKKSLPSKPMPPQDDIEEPAEEEPHGSYEKQHEKDGKNYGEDQELPDQKAGKKHVDEERENGKNAEPDGIVSVEGLTDEDLEEIGRRVLRLISGLRDQNGVNVSRKGSGDDKQKGGA